jgi:UDP-N-acetylmuramoyl-tripeptide--D-alanyl-D-alanine ligase
VVPGDSPFTPLWRELSGGRTLRTFALDAPADLSAVSESISIEWGHDGFCTRFVARAGGTELPLALRLAGAHNVRNALAAAEAALALGIGLESVQAGLAGLAPVPGRLCPRRAGAVRLIDDTYNANPDSIAAAVAVLVGLPGRHWLVLGDLGELGTQSLDLHREVGERALAAGVERLATVGRLSAAASEAFGPGAQHFPDQTSLAEALRGELTQDDLLLVKGSRTARMERVVKALLGESET